MAELRPKSRGSRGPIDVKVEDGGIPYDCGGSYQSVASIEPHHISAYVQQPNEESIQKLVLGGEL